jgi:hypothetical protein
MAAFSASCSRGASGSNANHIYVNAKGRYVSPTAATIQSTIRRDNRAVGAPRHALLLAGRRLSLP